MNKMKRGAIMALLKACRELAEAHDTGQVSGLGALRDRHQRAVEDTLDVELTDLDGPEVPGYVSLHGGPLRDWLVAVAAMAEDESLVHVLDVMIDMEGLKVRINGGPTWSPGFGEPRGSQ